MSTMTDRERELLIQELATLNAAIMTSFGAETVMLMTLQNELRERLGLSTDDYQDDSDSYRPAAA
jgi:hypothetical protein